MQDDPLQEPIEKPTSEVPSWTLYIDGSSTSSASDTRIVLISPKDDTLEYAL